MVNGANNLGGFNTVKWQAYNGSLARRLVIRTLMVALVISMLPLLQLLLDADPIKPMFLSSDGCDSDVGYIDPNSLVGRVLKPIAPFAFPNLRSEFCQDNVNLTIDV
ncbi:BEACH domain-containing protein A2, partial [Bienertia sinuspersici]